MWPCWQWREAAGVGEPPVDSSVRPAVTGNWGCGRRHGGDPQLKAALQWLAASRAQLPCLVYYTGGNAAVQTVGAAGGATGPTRTAAERWLWLRVPRVCVRILDGSYVGTNILQGFS